MRSLLSILAAALLLTATGCANKAAYNISPSYYPLKPRSIAVMPVEWPPGVMKLGWEDKGEGALKGHSEKISETFELIINRRLRSQGYSTLPVERSSVSFSGYSAPPPLESHIEASPIRSAEAKVLASSLGVDGIMFTTMADWDESTIYTYASFKVSALFELYSKEGTRLWRSSYKLSRRELNLDIEPAEYAVIKIFEPKLQRFVDSVFITLPEGDGEVKKREHFNWLK